MATLPLATTNDGALPSPILLSMLYRTDSDGHVLYRGTGKFAGVSNADATAFFIVLNGRAYSHQDVSPALRKGAWRPSAKEQHPVLNPSAYNASVRKMAANVRALTQAAVEREVEAA